MASGNSPEHSEMAALPPVCPPGGSISSARCCMAPTTLRARCAQLQGQRSVLELIIGRWAWPELFLNALVAAMLEANQGALTEDKLRSDWLELNP